ncbi:MAG: ATP-binding protein [Pseudomonadota bacterium]
MRSLSDLDRGRSPDLDRGRSSPTALTYLIAVLAVAALTGYADALGVTHNKVVAFWPAAGLDLWLVWRYGWTMVLPIAFGHWVIGFLFLPYDTAVGSLGNAAAALLGARLLRERLQPGRASGLANLLWIIGPATHLQALVAALIGGVYFAITLGLSGSAALDLIVRWAISDVAGALIVAPLLFSWSIERLRPTALTLRSPEVLVSLAGTVVLIAVGHLPIPVFSESGKILLLSAPLLLWLAVRPVSFAAMLGMLLTSLVALTMAIQNVFIDLQAILELQLFICIFLASAQLMQAILARQEELNDALANHSESLEQRVRERTREAEDARQRAEAADAAKSEFLANTSHEVRTPLNAILGMAEFLSLSNLDAEQRQQTETILSAGRSLMSVLNDVIDLSKVEAGKLEIAPQVMGTADFCQQIDSLWRPVAADKGLTFTLDRAPSVPPVLAFDAHRLLQCTSNLLSNAIKFTAEGSVSVRLSASSASAVQVRLRVSVQDSGIGMSPADQAKLFQPFEQLDSSITRRYGGTGLGLTITRRLAQLMGGDVEVSSDKGRGTTFVITILAARASAPEAEEHAPVSIDVAQLRRPLDVLLVEDNPVNRLVAKGHLRQLGWRFVEAENGALALEQLAQRTFDLVLCDVHMPVMDGIATTRAIRTSGAPWATVPIIALTADAMVDDRRKLLDIGMNGYTSKPIDRAALLEEIARVLAETEHPAAHASATDDSLAPRALIPPTH